MNLFNLHRKKEPAFDNPNSRLVDLSCEITIGERIPPAYARVESATEEKIRLIYNRRMSVLEEESKVTVNVFREDEPAILITGVVSTATSQHVDLKIEKQTELDYIRASFRTRVFIPGRLYLGDPDTEVEQEYDVMIDDISINGIMMSCPAELRTDDIGVLEFRLPNEVLYVPLMVRRVVERQDSIYKKYGGEFCDPSVKQSNTISHFVFQLNTAMRQHQSSSGSDFKLFKKAWDTVVEWEKTRSDRPPSMLNRYDRKSIAGQNNFFKRKSFTNRGK